MSTLMQSRWATAPTQKQTSTTPTPLTVLQVEDSQHDTPIEQPSAQSTLSAAAVAFSPSPAPPPDVSTHDEFAQTGANQDDVFNDIITSESMQTRPQDDLFGDDFTPAEQPVIETIPAEVQASVAAPVQHERAEPRSRGRGRGGSGAQQNTRKQSDKSDPPAPTQAPEGATTGPKKEVQAAVRGDRFATGGVKKPKLSEAELAEKMAQISIKNASLSAAHARAEADAASFEQREAQAKIVASQRSEAAKVRAKEERRDRQQMIGEREKNRLRKLKAIGGREWDAEKKEDDFASGGRYDKKGAFAGDQGDYTDGREYLLKDARPNGGKNDKRADKAPPAAVPKQADFPALPSTVAQSSALSPNEAGKSWADQVESSATSV